MGPKIYYIFLYLKNANEKGVLYRNNTNEESVFHITNTNEDCFIRYKDITRDVL